MAKRSPRLIFTEEERALPELERAVRKADRAAVKLEKAEAKIPKRTVKVRERVVDSESGTVTTRLFFEEADKKRPPSRLAHAAKKAPLDTVRSAVHRKLREEGDDNPGTEAANTLTETAERTWRIAESAHRSHAEKPYRKAKEMGNKLTGTFFLIRGIDPPPRDKPHQSRYDKNCNNHTLFSLSVDAGTEYPVSKNQKIPVP